MYPYQVEKYSFHLTPVYDVVSEGHNPIKKSLHRLLRPFVLSGDCSTKPAGDRVIQLCQYPTSRGSAWVIVPALSPARASVSWYSRDKKAQHNKYGQSSHHRLSGSVWGIDFRPKWRVHGHRTLTRRWLLLTWFHRTHSLIVRFWLSAKYSKYVV